MDHNRLHLISELTETSICMRRQTFWRLPTNHRSFQAPEGNSLELPSSINLYTRKIRATWLLHSETRRGWVHSGIE